MKISQKIKLGLHENIAKNLIFIDGVTRCGKSMFSHIIPSLERVEHIQFYEPLEYLVPGLSLGCLDEDYAKTTIRMQLNLLSYNLQISRNVNFRSSDQTGIQNYRAPKIYEERLLREEGDHIIDELRKTGTFIPFQTHDLLVNLDQLNKLEVDYRMLAIFRHPVDNVYSWWTRGWGDRFGNDPRAFTLTVEFQGKQLPWYCAGYVEEWLHLNASERCVRTVLDLIRKSTEQYQKTPAKEKIHLITFEDFAERPFEELQKICSFLGTEATPDTDRYVKAARCPRLLDPAEREKKLDFFKQNTKKELVDELLEMSEAYERGLYGLRVTQ